MSVLREVEVLSSTETASETAPASAMGQPEQEAGGGEQEQGGARLSVAAVAANRPSRVAGDGQRWPGRLSRTRPPYTNVALRLDPGAVAARICHAYGISRGQLRSKRRVGEDVTNARQLLYLLLHEEYGWSPSLVGRKLGVDHSTVLHGVGAARARLEDKEHYYLYRWVTSEPSQPQLQLHGGGPPCPRCGHAAAAEAAGAAEAAEGYCTESAAYPTAPVSPPAPAPVSAYVAGVRARSSGPLGR